MRRNRHYIWTALLLSLLSGVLVLFGWTEDNQGLVLTGALSFGCTLAGLLFPVRNPTQWELMTLWSVSLSWTALGAFGAFYDPLWVGLLAIGPFLALIYIGRKQGRGLLLASTAVGLLVLAHHQSALAALQMGFAWLLFGLAHQASSLRTQMTNRAKRERSRADLWMTMLDDAFIRVDDRDLVIDARFGPALPEPETPWLNQPLKELLPEVTDPRSSVVMRASQLKPNRSFCRFDLEDGTAVYRVRAGQKQGNEADFPFVAGKLSNMSTLVMGVAHEINNPLSIIGTNLEFALHLAQERNPSPEELREVIAEAQEGAERIRVIVQSLQGFARAEDSELNELVALESAIKKAVMMVKHRFPTRVTLEENYRPTPPVLGNPGRISQAIMHLLSNASAAIPPSQPGKVTISTGRGSQGEALVEIKDNGVGIDPQHQNQIFEPFFTTRDIGQGMGLGLPVTYGLVRRMGGEIDFASEPGKGALFRIRLPSSEDLVRASRTRSDFVGEKHRPLTSRLAD